MTKLYVTKGEIACGSSMVRVERGHLSVPMDWTKASGQQIEIAFTKFPATGSNHGPPIFYLAGGPGVSGTARAKTRTEYFQYLAQFGDVYAIDQRGIGQSTPCLDFGFTYDLTAHKHVTRQAFLNESLRLWRLGLARCKDLGVDPFFFTTCENAQDINALRKAIGAEQVVLLGGSYGSHLGLACLRTWGDAVARAVLFVVEGPDHTFKRPGYQQSVLANLSARLARADAWVGSEFDFLQTLTSVLENLDKAPLAIPAEDSRSAVTVGGFDVRKVIADGMGNTAHLKALPRHVLSMSRGDFSWAAEASAYLRQKPFGNLMTYVADLASGATDQRKAEIAAEAGLTILQDTIDLPIPDMASTAEYRDLGDLFRGQVTSDVPTQFLSGSLDGRTPPGNVQETIQGFSRAGHVLVSGGSHDTTGQFEKHPELSAVISDFLTGGDAVSKTIELAFEPDPPPSD